MWPKFFKTISRLKCILEGEDGQDLVEYALLLTLLVMFVTASIRPLATLMSNAFSNIVAKFTSAL